MQGETIDPDPKNALALANIVMSKVELLKYAEINFPYLANDREITLRIEEDEILELILDTDYIPILILASHSQGTSEEEVTLFFGQEFAIRFVKLIDMGVLRKLESDNWRFEKNIGASDLAVARKWIAVMASISPSKNDFSDKAAISYICFESVNLETAIAIYHAGMDYIRVLMRLTQDKKNRGDFLIMTGTLFNILKRPEGI